MRTYLIRVSGSLEVRANSLAEALLDVEDNRVGELSGAIDYHSNIEELDNDEAEVEA